MNTIGRYQLVEKLGQGGMGVVYRAMDPLLQRVVAVKLIGAMEPGSDVRERFFREARAAGQLSHKNIITIHDLGEHEGQPYLAMEFLQGEDLQQRMTSQVPMTLARKLELAIEICEGIEYAHDHGVIHRDIKPANIFLTTSGTAKILDFGLARLITSELTDSNMMMGTLNYMAPEQVRGERADHRSDIFSTGVVLYELLGGRKAFEGDSFGATLYKILEEVPEPLHNIDANLPPELVAIVEHALEKPRDARYPHMSDMLRDLTAYRQRLIVTNSPVLGGSSAGVVRPVADIAHDAQTFAAPVTPPPVARPGSGTTQAGGTRAPGAQSSSLQPPGTQGSEPPRPAAFSTRRPAVLASALAVMALVGAYAFWAITRGGAPPAEPAGPTADAAALATQQTITSQLEQASRALQAGDEAAAQRHADAVLAISPGHAEARRLRDQAQQASESVARGISNARNLLQSGRVDDAMRAAGEVLAVDPENNEAKRVMDDAASRSRGKGTDEARDRMAAAKRAATAAAAPTLAAPSYTAAVSAEREAANLYKRGRVAEAMAKFWEASGLFRSAEIAAQTEAAARSERARLAEAVRKPADPTPPDASASRTSAKPTTPAAETPAPPAAPAPATGLPLPPLPPVAVPTAPPPAAEKPAAETPPAPSPTSGITELLDRYKRALEARNLESLKRLWPSIGSTAESAIRHDFQNAKSIRVEIVNPQITVAGTSATVQFMRRYDVHTVDGQRLGTETRTTMNLHRTGATWIIDQIRFDTVR